MHRYCTLAALFSWFCAHAQRGALADQWASVGAGAATGTGATPGARTGRHQDTAQPGRYRGATGRNTATATGTRGPATGRAPDHGRRYRPGHHHGRAAMGLALDHGHQRQHGRAQAGDNDTSKGSATGARASRGKALPGAGPGQCHPLQTHRRGTATGRSRRVSTGAALGPGATWCRLGTSPAQNPAGPQLGTTGKPLPGPGAPPQGLHRPPAGDNATSRGQRHPLRRPETAPQGRGLGRGNGATGNPYRAQFLQCAGQTKSCQRFQARTAKKEEGRESVIHKKSE